MKQTLIFIVGPTSSGKTAVSTRLAEKIGGEIISCDSMQIYTGMDVLTQAPTEEILSKIKHHLVKEISLEEEFSAAEFMDRGSRAIENVLAAGKMPIITGGTGLYMKALLDGIFDSPPRDDELRETLENIAEKNGKESLHKKLQSIDPKTAEKLHPNDTKRIIRAIEVYELTGTSIEEKKKEAEGIWDKYNCRIFALDVPRDVLYDRINRTVDKMFTEGIIDEVKALLDKGLSITASKALGIREIGAFLKGDVSLEDATEDLKKKTRNYAKRQLTWFRGDDRIEWIDADRSIDEVVNEIVRSL